MNAKEIKAMQFEISALQAANKNLKEDLDEAQLQLKVLRGTLGPREGETTVEMVNRVIALHQDRVTDAQAEVRTFRARNEVLNKLVNERSDERDALLEAIETSLHGTKLDDCGNRDDDGLDPWGSTGTATRVLREALHKFAKVGA